VVTVLLLPFPLVYSYKRDEKARAYRVQSETPIEPGEEYNPADAE